MKLLNAAGLLLFLLLCSLSFRAQTTKHRHYFPVWSYHQKNVSIHGVSLGLWTVQNEPKNTNTNGIKIELIGIGMFMPLIPHSPVVTSDAEFEEKRLSPLSERINGISLSASGTSCHCLVNGLTAGFIGQIHFQVNGVALAGFMNFTQKMNGLMVGGFNEAYHLNGLQISVSGSAQYVKGAQIAILGNYAGEMKGLQIGLFNRSSAFRGIQIGLWNVNQHRKLPLINWSF